MITFKQSHLKSTNKQNKAYTIKSQNEHLYETSLQMFTHISRVTHSYSSSLVHLNYHSSLFISPVTEKKREKLEKKKNSS